MNMDIWRNVLKDVVIKIDPMGLIDCDTPESLDEYNPEINEILKEDISQFNEEALAERIYQVFVTFFDEKLAGDREQYALIARDFFSLLREKDHK